MRAGPADGGAAGGPEAAATASSGPGSMTHREVLEAMSGLVLSMFVAMLSSTVVSNALPRILHDLHGGESSYTWVVTSTLLATTASTPLWGKLSDLLGKKSLMQVAIVVFTAGSLVAGLSQSVGMLIACRVVQGIGAGGILALTQVVMASMVSPRERGRYSGYLGATFAVATIAGPLTGGLLVDSRLGWRACFYVGIPFAVAALVVLQRTLHLPTVRREVRVDYLGATVLTGGVSALLVWVSLAGRQFAWLSGASAAFVVGGVGLLALAVVVELRAAEPVIPLELFRHRTVALATGAGLGIGVALFGATIFLSQYFQISRGLSPTASGFRTIPMVAGLAVSSLVVGRLVSATGRWKRFIVGGSVTATVGMALLSTIDARTPGLFVAAAMALFGLGIGATLQNLVLSVQNTVPVRQLGAATATVSFFRSLGGAIGVSVLGAVLANSVSRSVAVGLGRIGAPALPGGSSIPDVRSLPGPVAAVVRQAYGDGVALSFRVATPLLLLAVVAILAIREVPLGSRSGAEQAAELDAEVAVAGGADGKQAVAASP